jgi:multiple sugar transport system permease protein
MAVVGTEEIGQLRPPRAAVVLAPPKRRRGKRWKPARGLRYVVLIVGGIIFIAPFAYMVTASFQPIERMFSYPPQWIPTDPTVFNYKLFFNVGLEGASQGQSNVGTTTVLRWFANSFFVAGTVTFFQLFLGSLAAYCYAKRKFPGRNLLFFLGLATLMIPPQVTVIPVYLIMKHIPLFGGNDLRGLGGHGWLDSYWALIVPNLVSPFGVFLLRQYMKSIPDELLDAAKIDGAGHFRIYFRIVLPLSLPALAAVGIFTFQFFWEDFLGPLIMINSAALYTVPLGLALFVIKNRTVWNVLMAGSVAATVPMIVVFLLFQRHFVRGISLSGLKG